MRREAIAPIALGALLLAGWAISAGAGSPLLPTPGAVGLRLLQDLGREPTMEETANARTWVRTASGATSAPPSRKRSAG